MMKRLIPALILLLALSSASLAQTSNVTATVTDADSQTWNNGTYTISYVQPPNNATAPVWNGTPMTPSQKLYTGSLNGSGVLTIALPDNAFITPAGSLWLFVICPNASAQCTQVPLKVTGASPDLSTLISTATITPRFSALLNAYGYLDVEVTPTPVPGGSYFNVTNGVTRVWTGSAWANQGSGAGGGVTSITGTTDQVSVSPTTGAAVASLPSTLIAPGTIAATTTVTGTQLISNIATGTAPLSVASTTVVPNLNVSQLGGATFAAPGAIGGTTPSTGAFTTLAASSTVSGAGFSTYLASPPAIGGTAAAAGAFTTLSASSTVSGTGFSTYLASPPAIGGTAPSTGAFTTLTGTSSATLGANGGTAGSLVMNGATSGSMTLTVSSTSNNMIDSGAFSATNITGSGNVSGTAFLVGGTTVVTGGKTFIPAVDLVTFSTTPTINLNSGNFIQFPCTTAASSITPTFSNMSKGIEFTVIFVQNGTTPCTWTWPSNTHGGVTVSVVLSSISVEKFIVSNNGTDAYLVDATVGTTGGTP